MKINKKYTGNSYDVQTASVNADLSEDALEHALINLKYELGNTYTLHVGRGYLRDIVNLTAGLRVFNIYLELEENLIDEWYLVDEKNKVIFYSAGA